jgi:hypothetical protein
MPAIVVVILLSGNISQVQNRENCQRDVKSRDVPSTVATGFPMLNQPRQISFQETSTIHIPFSTVLNLGFKFFMPQTFLFRSSFPSPNQNIPSPLQSLIKATSPPTE